MKTLNNQQRHLLNEMIDISDRIRASDLAADVLAELIAQQEELILNLKKPSTAPNPEPETPALTDKEIKVALVQITQERIDIARAKSDAGSKSNSPSLITNMLNAVRSLKKSSSQEKVEISNNEQRNSPPLLRPKVTEQHPS